MLVYTPATTSIQRLFADRGRPGKQQLLLPALPTGIGGCDDIGKARQSMM